ncbi:MAG: Ycf51 family protein [Cyanobacteria bacterium SID2]|nr:Ycf51 family protein [Cyanobacteria bacterium SID2]
MYLETVLAVLTPADFWKATQWSSAMVGFFVLLTTLAFLLKWGIRFRLVGATGFSIVLTVGLFALSFVPITSTAVPGSVHYSIVYDNGGGQIVMTVPTDITESQLEATLRQVAIDRFSPGRLGQTLLIRARTLLHEEDGVSEPLYLGQVKRQLAIADETAFEIEIDRSKLKRLAQL